MRESKVGRAARAAAIYERLERELPDAKCALDFGSKLDLLVAVILSAQCTDKLVNEVTPALFARCPAAADYARLGATGLEPFIRRVGLFHTKAKNLAAMGAALVERHSGEVPGDRDALEALPGVGRKTAGVVLANAFDVPALPVDTHVGRVARRLGLTTHDDPDKVEADLCTLLPKSRWSQAHHLFIWHGRKTCAARAPACERCVVETLCPKRGV